MNKKKEDYLGRLASELHSDISKISLKKNVKLERAFLLWYLEAQYDGENIIVTDGPNDGYVDAIITKSDGKVIVIQSKFNEKNILDFKNNNNIIKKEDYDPYDKIIDEFKSDVKFNEYLKRYSIVNEMIMHYNGIHKNYSNVTFELITTFNAPKNLSKTLKNLKSEKFIGLVDILRLFELRQDKLAPAAEDMEIRYESSFIHSDQNPDIISYVLKAKLKDLVEYIKNCDPFDRIIAQNVRVNLKTKINDEILESFQQSPQLFWYKHNGITMLSDEIIPGKGKVRVRVPRIINGAQTIMTLRNAKTASDDASVLLKIFEIKSHESQYKEIINEIIFSTNQQNPMQSYMLRANDSIQLDLAEFFESKGVFYERRKNEFHTFKRRPKYQGFSKLKIVDLAKILMISKNGARGVVQFKQKKKELFRDPSTYKSTFNGENAEIFFQYCIYEIVSHVFKKDIKRNGKRFLESTTFGIVWALLKAEPAKYSTWKNEVNKNQYKTIPSKNAKLKAFCNDIKTIFGEILNHGTKLEKTIPGFKSPQDFIKNEEANIQVFNKLKSRERMLRKHFDEALR